MFPLRDDNPTHRFPVLTVLLIALNVGIFLYQLSLPAEVTTIGEFAGSQSGLICEYAAIPDRLLDGQSAPADPGERLCVQTNEETPRGLGAFTHQFLHGSWLHLLGNMLFLWVFGNNVEDRLGRIRFLPFYLLCGVAAVVGQAVTDPDSAIPVIGASGAISGVLGAYFVLYPRVRVLTLVTVVPLRLRAWIVLGVYIAFQFFYVSQEAQDGESAVAYWAHIVGFIAGMVLILPFLIGRRAPALRTADG